MKRTRQIVLDGALGKIEESSLVIFLTQKSDSQKEAESEGWRLEKAQRVLFDKDTSFEELHIDLENKHDSTPRQQLIFKSDFKIEDAISIVTRREEDGETFLVADSVRRIILK